MSDPMPEIRDAVESRGFILSSPRSRSGEKRSAPPSPSCSGGAMVIGGAFSFPFPLTSRWCLVVGSRLSPKGTRSRDEMLCPLLLSLRPPVMKEDCTVAGLAIDGPASISSAGEGVCRTDGGRLMRCSAPALRSRWRLIRLETDVGVRRGKSPNAERLAGSAGATVTSRGTGGGGGVDGRRGLVVGVVGVLGVLGVELVGFHRRAAETGGG